MQAERDASHRQDGLTTDERDELRTLRRENKILREEKEIQKEAMAWFARETRLDSAEGFEFVRAHRATHQVRRLCRELGVSARG